MQGVSAGFFRGDPLLLVEDIQELQPTMFCRYVASGLQGVAASAD